MKWCHKKDDPIHLSLCSVIYERPLVVFSSLLCVYINQQNDSHKIIGSNNRRKSRMEPSCQWSKIMSEPEVVHHQKNSKTNSPNKNHECGTQLVGQQAKVWFATLHQGQTYNF